MIAAFTDGRADAVLAGGAQGPLLRRIPRPPGRVILQTMTDKPWSEYVCCTIAANRDWARQNPIATKRVTRALLRATVAAAKGHADCGAPCCGERHGLRRVDRFRNDGPVLVQLAGSRPRRDLALLCAPTR
jgi:hypothetical protein